jgi:DNA-binding MarR family transcriptional regulator
VAKPLDLPFDPIARAAQIWEERFGPAEPMAAVTSIMRAQQLLIAALDGVLRERGLTFARYEALVLLAFSSRGSLPLRVMGERLMVHPTSVTNLIGRLERQGLVRRRPNPRDGRGKLAELTGRGREVMAAATADLMAARFGMAGYETAELAALFSLLRGLRVAAGDFTPSLAPAGGRAAGDTGAAAGASTGAGRDAAPLGDATAGGTGTGSGPGTGVREMTPATSTTPARSDG